ncbi:MAG: DUF58 domain-containing protein [Gemmatimonadetes bacterium]|nr:DUF58 domain-containing protein [Gemmatimonadota bacterium]
MTLEAGAGPLPPHLLERLGGLEFVARRVVEGFVAGAHRSPYRGAGEEFARHRAYQQGDPLRHIDWRVYARSDRLFVREYRENSSLHCWVIVDATLSMGYSDVEGITKLRYAAYLAAALTHIMLRAGDAVGFASVSDEPVLHIPPRNRRGQLHDVLIELQKLRPRGSTPMADVVDAAAAVLRRRGRVVVISDLLADDDGAALLSAIGRLRARGSEVAVLRVLTPEESSRRAMSDAAFFDPERARETVVGSTTDPAYGHRLNEYYAALADGLRECGAEYVEADTDEPVEHALSAWLLAR